MPRQGRLDSPEDAAPGDDSGITASPVVRRLADKVRSDLASQVRSCRSAAVNRHADWRESVLTTTSKSIPVSLIASLTQFYLPSRMARARFAAGRSQQRWSQACVRGHFLVSIDNAR